VCLLLFETLMAAIDCVILSSVSENDYEDAGGCEEMQSSILEAQSEVEEQSGDECLTPPRPKSMHVGAAQYKCSLVKGVSFHCSSAG